METHADEDQMSELGGPDTAANLWKLTSSVLRAKLSSEICSSDRARWRNVHVANRAATLPTTYVLQAYTVFLGFGCSPCCVLGAC
jgi:hypothetical protein